MNRLSRSTLLAVLLAATMAVAVPVAEAGKRRGVQRNYSGARWAPSPQSLGWHAILRLDRASVRQRGGFIAQTLWAATNGGKARFGRNKRTAYVQVSVSRGFRGRKGNHIVVAQRTPKGGYSEGRSRGPAVEFGKDYPFSLVSSGGDWEISLGGDNFATAKNTGNDIRSYSAFAGIESTSGRNRARGAVKELSWVASVGRGAASFPKWRVGNKTEGASVLVRRGRASVRWTDKHYSLRNSFGR